MLVLDHQVSLLRSNILLAQEVAVTQVLQIKLFLDHLPTA